MDKKHIAPMLALASFALVACALAITPTATISPIAVDLPGRITDGHGVPMALIPAGPFQMGGDPDAALVECQKFRADCQRTWFENESPIHTVILDAFYMDIYEVTNARYADCVSAGKCDPPSDPSSNTRSSYYGNLQYADYPAIYVSWNDAQAYCAWRGARLPTEAEWEKAARGELEGKLYPWGNDEPVCTASASNGAQFSPCIPGDTVAVGSFAPNGYGLYGIAGNVWEWVNDWYIGYPSGSVENPMGPDTGNAKTLRGGGWDYSSDNIRVAIRSYDNLTSHFADVGFRCGATPEK